MWPKRLREIDRDYWIETKSKDSQHANSNFSKSTQFYKGETTPTVCRNSYFQTIYRLTKKQYARNWLCYSENKGRFFCFPCKVMASIWLTRFPASKPNRRRAKVLEYSFGANNRGCQVFS